ncbi:hypothetical protein [Nonomuraea endophytica]|uniref:Uncharacterized protein n=1 Tax=Nonomuraea endophytica TaxID=714136 RepID=A0A7W8AA71_9ACTN|nr:hypothetical protein [Nonomuraea endophytica]MBB5081456.1 hypothetical protein [Nonomuraea endophytica]
MGEQTPAGRTGQPEVDSAARLEHTTAVLGQTTTAWAAEAKARDALTGSSHDGPERDR